MLKSSIQYGANPSGTTVPLSRRRKVLRLARQYNFLIMEDDPYFYLYFGSAPRPPSYFSLERSEGGEIGRVLRFDSFSKIISGGLRLGWATGPAALLDALELHVSKFSGPYSQSEMTESY
jgi:tryptophan aminotransferase